MTRILTAISLCTLIILPASAIEEVRLEDFSIQFEQGVGQISSGKFTYKDSLLSLSSPSINQGFSLEDSFFESSLGGIEVGYQLDQDGVISKIKALHTQNLNFDYIPGTRLALSSSGISISQTEGSQYIPTLDLECKKEPTKSSISELINPCLELGRLEMPILDLDQLSSAAISKTLTGIKSNKGIEKIEEISMLVFNRNFQLSFKAKFLFKLKVKAQGQIDYNEDQGTIRIHLKKAKVGIFSIRKTLLKELREANISGVTISGNFITLKI